MPTLRFTVQRITPFEVPRISEQEMRRLAEEALRLNTNRWDRAINARDQRAKPLQVKVAKSGARYGYAIQKSRKGLRNIRDWLLTGQLRRAFAVLEAKPNMARIGWNDSAMGKRAGINQAREEMFGFSPSDVQSLTRMLTDMLNAAFDRLNRRAA